jgi:hypothetical protein
MFRAKRIKRLTANKGDETKHIRDNRVVRRSTADVVEILAEEKQIT